MSIDLGDSPVGTPPSAGEQAQIRAAIGLGSSDTVEFGAFVPPSGTTAEIDAVSDAVEGQLVFDTDNKQMVRFTGSATYERISTRTLIYPDLTSEAAALTLAGSRLFESGLFAASPDVLSPQDVLVIYNSKDPGTAAGSTYFYHSGEQVAAGWYLNGAFSSTITTDIFTPDTLLRITDATDSSKTPLTFHNYISSSSFVDLASLPLKADINYSLSFALNFLDLLGGNFKIKLNYSGDLGDGSSYQITSNDLKSKTQILNYQIVNPDNLTTIALTSSSFFGVDNANFGSMGIEALLSPTTSGTLTISIAQVVTDSDMLYYDKASIKLTALSS